MTPLPAMWLTKVLVPASEGMQVASSAPSFAQLEGDFPLPTMAGGVRKSRSVTTTCLDSRLQITRACSDFSALFLHFFIPSEVG